MRRFIAYIAMCSALLLGVGAAVSPTIVNANTDLAYSEGKTLTFRLSSKDVDKNRTDNYDPANVLTEADGMEWKEPDFLLRDIASQSLTFTRDGRYLSTSLPGGVRLFSFKLSSAEVATSQSLNLLAHFALNEYKGRTSLDILVEKA